VAMMPSMPRCLLDVLAMLWIVSGSSGSSRKLPHELGFLLTHRHTGYGMPMLVMPSTMGLLSS
jgi:hypothetical protein